MATTPAAVMQVIVTANTAGANAALAKTQAQLKGTAAAGSTMGSRLASATKAGAVGVAALGAVSVKLAVDFDKAMRNVNSIAQLSEKQLASLSNQVRDLAGKTAQSPQTLAEGLYDLVSSGFDAKESMTVLHSSAKAATAGLTDTATSTKAVAAALNAYRMPAKKAKDVSDIMFRTVDRGVISFETLAGSIGNALPAAAALGVPLDALGASIATLTKQGQSGESAIVNINAAMTSLFKPTDAMKDALKELGYQNAEALIEAEGFQGGLQSLIDTTDGTTAAVGELFSNVRSQRAVFGLTGDNAKGAAEDLKGLESAAGATNKALSQQSQSVAYMWQKLKAEASAFAIGIGNKVIPVIKHLFDVVNNPKLTLDEKLSKIGKIITRAVEHALPDVLKAGASIGVAIARGVLHAFMSADLLGKVFIGAAALRVVGGSKVLGSFGTRIGKIMGRYAGPALAVGLITLGLTDKKFREAAVEGGKRIGELFVNGMISVINAGLRSIFDAAQMGPLGEGLKQLGIDFGDVAPQIDTVAFSKYQKIIDSGVKDSAQNIFDATDKLKQLIAKQNDYRDALKASQPSLKSNAEALDTIKGNIKNLNTTTHSTDKIWDKYYRQIDKSMKMSNKAVDDHRRKVHDGIDDVDRSTDKGRNAFDRYQAGAGDSMGKLTGKSARMARGISGNNNNMVNAVGSGLGTLRDNLNKALKSFNVKQVAYSIKNAAKSVGNVIGAQQGAIVPGQMQGDRHVLSLNGTPIAKVESGEKIAVVNRKAAAYEMALNKAVPRFATGGMVDPAGPGTGVVNAAIADVVGRWSQAYNAAINYGYDPGGGHLSPGHNVTGTATDTGPADGWGSETSPSTKLFEDGLRKVVSAGLTVLYGSHGIGTPYPNHGWGNHAHIEWGMHPSLKGIGSAAAFEALKKIVLDGPDGPQKELGQAMLNKAWKGANAYLEKQAPSGLDGGGPMAGSSYKGPLNKVFPHWTSLSNPGVQLSESQTKSIMDPAGLPDVFNTVAYRESGRHPGIMGVDPGGTRGLGMWMITTGFNDGLIRSLGGEDQMANPVVNSEAAKRLYEQGGMQPWAPSGPYAKGGLIDLTKTIGKLMSPGPSGTGKRADKYNDKKHDKAIIDKVRERLKALTKAKNYPTKGGELTGRLAELRELADQYNEWSSYATDFGKDFHGKDAAGWKQSELGALAKLRNNLIRAEKMLKQQQAEVAKVLKEAEKRQRKFEHRAKQAQRQLDEKGKDPKKWKGISPLDDVKKWNALKDKERLHLAHKFRNMGGKLSGDRKFAEDGSLLTAKSHPSKFPDVGGLQGVAGFLKNTVIGTLKGSSGVQGALNGSMQTVLDELESVQGKGFSHKLTKELRYGMFGGQIFDAQRTLREMRASSSELNGISIQDVLDIAEAARYNAFASLPKAHTGADIVGPRGMEVPVLARTGESIVPTNERSTGKVNVIVNVASGMEWLEKFIDVRIDDNDKEYAKISSQGVKSV